MIDRISDESGLLAILVQANLKFLRLLYWNIYYDIQMIKQQNKQLFLLSSSLKR